MPLHRILARLNWAHLAMLAALPGWFLPSSGMSLETRLAAWLLLNYVVFAAAERLQPHRIDWHPDRRAVRHDGSVLALNLIADGLASALLALGVAAITVPSSTLPFALQVVLGIGLGELGAYVLHRTSHRDGWLWRVHLLHHRPERLNAANALTAHPINAVYDKLARVLPMAALGCSADAIVAVTMFTLTQNIAAHANVAGTLGPLNLLIGTAELHRLHHSTDERQAVNFGTAVPWWDLLFGTYLRGEQPAAVGVFEPVRYPAEHATLRLLGWPLQRWRPKRPAAAATCAPPATPSNCCR